LQTDKNIPLSRDAILLVCVFVLKAGLAKRFRVEVIFTELY